MSSQEISKKKYGKPVRMLSLDGKEINTFSSLNDAATYMVENNLTGCKQPTIKQHISEVCRGIRKTAAKYRWEFIVDSNNES